MNTRITTIALTLACLAATGNVLADCGASGTIAGTRKAFNDGLRFERAGNITSAFAAYIDAQEPTCEPNPVEADAARRAATLALPLGSAAEKKGDYQRAFYFYDTGGQYAAADRALMALIRTRPDDPHTYSKAREVLDARTLPAFQSNNRIQLAITGPYQPDPKNLAEVLEMPANGVARAFAKEAEAFNEQYLREYVARVQSRPDDLTDFEALQAWGSAQQAFVQKWGDDRLEISRDAFSLVQSWIGVSTDQAWSAQTEAQRRQRLEQRVATLTASYSGAPKLLEHAIGFALAMNLDSRAGRVAAIKAQAGRLGDEASAKQRYGLAAEYFDVAGQDAKARAAQEQQRKISMAKMQPTIDQMQQQAQQIQKEFSDPARVKAMQEQAQALRKSMLERQQANAAANARKADDLEKELGL